MNKFLDAMEEICHVLLVLMAGSFVGMTAILIFDSGVAQ